MSEKKTKSRKIDLDTFGTRRASFRNVTVPPSAWSTNTSSKANHSSFGTQVTVSSGHPFSHRRGGNKGDVGGEFYTNKRYVKISETNSSRTRAYIPNINGQERITEFFGPICAIPPHQDLFPTSNASSKAALEAIGTKAVEIVKPTNSVADLSVALGELYKDKLPALPGVRSWKPRTLHARNAGDEYLNVQFGWLPLVSDINNVSYGISNAERIMAQYERDAGKPVRRTFHFPIDRSVTESVGALTIPWMEPDSSDYYDLPNRGNLIVSTKTERHRWFSGCFTYTIPLNSVQKGGIGSAAAKASHVLGLDLTPDVVWNLTPWSWATDWFTNMGSVVSNLSDAITDGLVMQYGYIMETATVSKTYTLSRSGLRDKSTTVADVTFVNQTKQRYPANPFGFGLSWNGLTPRQLAIATALGLSRS